MNIPSPETLTAMLSTSGRANRRARRAVRRRARRVRSALARLQHAVRRYADLIPT